MSYLTIYIWSNILFKKDNIKMSDIYVSITVSLLLLIYMNCARKNSQHSMLANHGYKNNSIGKYYREILPTFMLELCVFSPVSWL